MKANPFLCLSRRGPVKVTLFLFVSLLGMQQVGHADTASVVTAANTLLTTSTAQTSPYALTVGVSTTYSLTYDKKWTNLPGTPPDSNRNGPVIGGGPVSFNAYELSSTVSSGQTVSPRAAALTLATTALSTFGYNTFYEIRNADDVIRTTQGSSAPWQYGDYHVATLGTPSTSSPWMLQFTGHHLAYNITYNGPFVSATPMFIGTEPPDYHSIGTDLTAAQQAVVVGTDTVSSTTYTGDFLVSYPFTTSPTVSYYRTATGAASIGGSTAISGATSTSYTIASPTASDNGFYYCVATNSSGSTSSNTVVLTIAGTENNSVISSTSSTGTSPSPIITTQPASRTIKAGTSVTFTVAASNATSYQWYKLATTHRAPLETQRTAVCSLAVAVQADSTLASSAVLSGTFSDVVLGVTNAGDGNFPFVGTKTTYPTGTTGRGARLGSMTATQQATIKPLMKAMIEAWVTTQASDISAALLADYESDTALADTYVGYQVGAGAADSGGTRCNFDATINQEATPINSQNSYLRIDGPRCWIEMVVQAAVAYKSNGFVHYHSLWRDRLADYGNEFGGFLDTTSTATTYTRPSFTTQPASVSGSSATFTSVATANSGSGAVTPVYQWYNVSTGIISGATSSSYTTSTAGSYYVTATTDYGTTASNTVTLSSATATAPTITTQPTTQTVVSGNTATFTVAATGSGTLSYQWYNASGAISGATSASYTTGTADSYYVIVTNTVGTSTATTTSSTATLYVNTAPTITTQPTSQTVSSGSSATFTVVATGNGTLSYQWYNASGAISGATAASYTTATAGTYHVIVTNTLNSTTTITTSSSATLTVSTAATPTITTQPISQTVNAGSSVTFTVAATGSGTLSYQWYFGGTAISGATSATYTISLVTASNAGSYYVIVTNTVGTSTASTTSSTAALTVNAAPTITTQPSSQNVVLGNSATFSVAASGSGTLSYQWYKGSVGSGSAISGATSSSYTIAKTTSSSAGSYYVAVTNSVGTTNSTAATLTLTEPFAAFLSTYGLTGTDPSTDSDGDGISNLMEFVLGGNPTVSDTSILPTVSYTTSGGTTYLIYSFYTVTNLGSVTWTVESSTDLSTYTTAVSGTDGVTITTTAYDASYNYTVVSIPNAAGGSLFARLRATLPSTYTGTVSGSANTTKIKAANRRH